MAGVGKVPPAGAVLASVATGTVPGDESGCQVIGVPIDPQMLLDSLDLRPPRAIGEEF